MLDRVSSLWTNALEGDFFVIILIVLWGLLMAGLAYKMAGWAGLNKQWQKFAAIGGFVSLGLGVLVVAGRWVWKAFFNKPKDEET